MTTRRKTTKKSQASAIMDSVQSLNPSDVVEEISKLQLTLQGTLAGISATVASQIEKMRAIDENIDDKENSLQELHAIEKEAQNIEAIKTERAKEEAAWDKAVQDRQIKWDEDEDDHGKKVARQDDEFNYSTLQKRKRFLEEFNAEVASTKRSEQLRQFEQNRDYKAREESIKTQEDEIKELKKNATGFDDKIKAAVDEAKAKATNSIKKQYEHQIQLLQKDAEAERTVDAAQIQSLESTIGDLRGYIADLQKQLTTARTDAKEVTEQALQSASGRHAMAALQKVVDGRNDSGKSK